MDWAWAVGGALGAGVALGIAAWMDRRYGPPMWPVALAFRVAVWVHNRRRRN